MTTFTAEKKERLDKFLSSNLPVSRGRIQKAIKDGLVLVNGQKVLETDFQVSENDQIELPEFENYNLKPITYNLKVVFENDDLAVIDKPAGFMVHPAAGRSDATLANALLSRFPGIEKIGDPHRPGIVHRLDEDTSGLLVIAKNQKSFEYLKNLFQTRNIEKEYLALVHGVPAKLHDVINVPLAKNPKRQKMSVGVGKEAVTEYWILETTERNAELVSASQKRDPEINSGLRGGSLQYSLLRVKLHTGRTHQIRAHLCSIGHPIVGDQAYGGLFKQEDFKILSRQFLHAYRLKFKLLNGSVMELFAELPPELKQFLDQLGLKYDDSSNI